MKRIVILTGSELRHDFFRQYLARSEKIEVINSYCEDTQTDLSAQINMMQEENSLRRMHLQYRYESEEEFFGEFLSYNIDISNPVNLSKGSINEQWCVDAIIDSEPEIVVAFGCSIIREPLLTIFKGKFLNVHLGLSPYCRGSGTNYWPLVNGEPEYVGATFMHIDSGIDTGEVIHQIRAQILLDDSPSRIGTRLIKEMTEEIERVIEYFDSLAAMPQLQIPRDQRVYRTRDFSEESVAELYAKFDNGVIDRYLNEESARCTEVPIIENVSLESSW